MPQHLSDFQYRKDTDVLQDLQNLKLWNWKLTNKYPQAKIEAIKIARIRQKCSSSDRFVFQRVLSALLAGLACPEDYKQ